MTTGTYRITPYRSEWGEQVAKLMIHLWGADVAANRAYLRWKYEESPVAAESMAFAALHEGRVVGFRGFMPLPFRSAGGSDVIILCPGDTCVHPDHRRAGLSVRMGREAMRWYGGRYPLFMNWSCTAPSLPGYLKMGFRELATKEHLTHAGALETARYLAASRCKVVKGGPFPPQPGSMATGGSWTVEVATAARPSEMASMAAGDSASGVLELQRDAAFLAWRYANPRGRYVFYILQRGELAAAYLTIGLSANNRRGFLLDFAGEGALEEIVPTILTAGHYDVLSVYTYSLSPARLRTLEGLGFSVSGLFQCLDLRRTGRLPLLVRPVNETFGEGEWRIGELDARDSASWSLMPIGSDAV